MTEYGYFPPIRFQFEGDEEKAKSRIPQARVLMQQLIRRMETSELDALNWRVNTADGTYFEVHKYGDQHIALIRAPVFVDVKMEEEDEEYLWIGAKILPLPYEYTLDYDKAGETLLPSSNPPHKMFYQGTAYGTNWGFVFLMDQPYKAVDYAEVLPMKPMVNLMLFEPNYGDGEGSVIETYLPYTDPRASDQNDFLASAEMYPVREITFQATVSGTTYGGNTQEDFSVYFQNCLISTKNGMYTTGPYTYKKDNPIDVHAYIAIDANDPPKKRADLRSPPKVTNLPHEATYYGIHDVALYAEGNVYSSAPSKPYEIEEVAIDGLHNPEPTKETITFEYDLVYEADATVEYDKSFSTKGTVLDGVYELRLMAGWPVAGNYDEYDSNIPLECEVYIQVGKKIQTYQIQLPQNYDSDQFNAYWKPEYNPVNTTNYYQGCWLIDIKQGTVIHETRPDKLKRPWFT